MLDHLEGIEPGETVSLAEGVKNFCLRNSGKGIVVLISDLMDKAGYEAALRYLVSREMDVYVIHVLSAEESTRTCKAICGWSIARTATWPRSRSARPLLKRYKQTLAAFVAWAREFCPAAAWSICWPGTRCRSSELVTGYLRTRGLVR